jgi:hypothetical protein
MSPEDRIESIASVLAGQGFLLSPTQRRLILRHIRVAVDDELASLEERLSHSIGSLKESADQFLVSAYHYGQYNARVHILTQVLAMVMGKRYLLSQDAGEPVPEADTPTTVDVR